MTKNTPKVPGMLFGVLCFPSRAGGGEGKPLALQIGCGLWFQPSCKTVMGEEVKDIFSVLSTST